MSKMNDIKGDKILNLARYDNKKILKLLYGCYNGYKRKSENGEDAATSVKIDLEYGLEIVSPEEKQAVKLLLIEHYTYEEASEDTGFHRNTLVKQIDRALTKISEALINGNVKYKK